MNKKIVKSSLIALAVASGSLVATDFHAPLPGGPLRYDFEKVQKNKSTFNFWSTGYMREADKAYMKHGFDTHPYTTLIFGKDKFKIAEAFQGATDDVGFTKNRNPYLNNVYFAPRASFSERGIVLGAQWSYPVWSNKGRIGLRGSIPLRSVRIEKDDEMEHAVTGPQEKAVKGETRRIPQISNQALDGVAAAANNRGPIQLSDVSSYNLKFLSSVKYINAAGNIIRLFDVGAANDHPSLQGNAFPAVAATAGRQGINAPCIIIKANYGGQPPYGQGGALLYDAAGGVRNYVAARTAQSNFVYFDGTGTLKVNAVNGSNEVGGAGAGVGVGVLQGVAAGIAAGGNASSMVAIGDNWTGNYGVGQALMLEDALHYPIDKIPEDLWVTTIHDVNGRQVDDPAGMVRFIDSILLYYRSDLTDFLNKSGFVFQTYQLTGLGDTDLDLFYNHSFCDRWNGEIYAGVRLPTGAGDKYYGNPYKALLGNGDHFELKVGGKIAWDTCKWLNFKADAHYNFVLEATEHRMAAYTGATIKNLGPKADADVSWGYFTGDIDFTLFHPRTKDIATTIGYELYYKTEDRISFKQKDMSDHWLGQVWAQVGVSTPATAAAPGDHWADLPWTLSNTVARKNTESIGHRAYLEGSYQFNKYLLMTVGGKYTFAGQNIPCEGEAYGGFNVKF